MPVAVEIPENLDKVFSWSAVNLSVSQGKDKPDKQLLKRVSGYVKAGEIVAIMGGSGAGKSSLLNTLAGRIENNTKLDGEILVDGHPRNPANWRLQCAYVEQDDILLANLTVFETLMYSARLRLTRKLSYAEKTERVNAVIRQLGLEGCRNTKIGDSLSRGISGGERKRVSIGIELVTNPHILFLDEPTSGLDAFNAFNCIQSLQKLAREKNMIILLTIHQPRTDILDLFDKIVLLSMGECVWFGQTHDCIEHFAKHGFQMPAKTNPSDFFLDTITADRRSDEKFAESTARIQKLVEAYKPLIDNSFHQPVKADLSAEDKKIHWPSTWIGELYTLIDRNIVNDWRDKATVGAGLGGNVFVLILMSALFHTVSRDVAGVQNRLGFFFFLTTNLTFSVIGPTINQFPGSKKLTKRERSAGSYRSSSAYIATILAKMPMLILGNLILSLPIYWIVGLQASFYKYLIFIIICLVQSTCAFCLGLVIGSAVPTAQIGQALGPLILILFMLFSGLLANIDSIWVGIRWIQYIDLIAYTYKALGQNEFDSGLVFDCATGAKCFRDGVEVVQAYSLKDPELIYCVFINLGFIGAYALLGIAIFNRTSAPIQKLK